MRLIDPRPDSVSVRPLRLRPPTDLPRTIVRALTETLEPHADRGASCVSQRTEYGIATDIAFNGFSVYRRTSRRYEIVPGCGMRVVLRRRPRATA